MHVPDHFLDPATSVATAIAAGAALSLTAARLRRSEAPTVRPGVFAATTGMVFGLQMLNYPVASGTSGHLLGGALAAAVLGPVWGMAAITVVLLAQGLLFADGGLGALGTNVLLMAVIGVLVGWFASRGALRLAGAHSGSRLAAPVAAGAGALASVVAAALAFTALFAVGGTVAVPLGALAGQMLGVHALIGLGEAAITMALTALVAVVAPQALALTRDPAHASVATAGFGASLEPAAARASAVRVAVALGSVAFVAAAVLSSFASGSPDGLEATAQAVGFADAARDHALAGLPLADYGEAGHLFVGLVGLLGVAVSGLAAFGTAWSARAWRRGRPAAALS